MWKYYHASFDRLLLSKCAHKAGSVVRNPLIIVYVTNKHMTNIQHGFMQALIPPKQL
jgi:hypothetical protein